MTNEELESRISQLEDRMASQEEESRMILETIGELDKMIGAVETLAGNARQGSFIVAGASGNRMNRIEERLAALEKAHKVGAHNATGRKADDAKAEISELRARIKRLESFFGELVKKAEEFETGRDGR